MDEARLVAVQAHPPREVRGIHADAVPTDPRSRIERHEAEGLGRGGLDDLARAHAELPAHQGELVGERDVDVAEDVLVELGELGDARARDRDDAVDDLAVEHCRQRRALGRETADDLGNVLHGERRVRGVDPLRREGQEAVDARPAAARLEHRGQQLLRRPRIRGRLEDHELGGSEPRGRFLGGGRDEGDVGILRFPQRRRHADDHRVALGEAGEVGRRLVAADLDSRPEHVVRHVGGVRSAGVEVRHAIDARVEAGHGEADPRELDGERKADVALTDDADAGGAVGDTAGEVGRGHGRSLHHARSRWASTVSRGASTSAGMVRCPDTTIRTVSSRILTSSQTERCLR